MRALKRGRLRLRLAFGIGAVVLAAAATVLMRNPMGAGNGLSRLWFWSNSPALALAGWLSGTGLRADVIAIYGTFPLQWFLVGVAVSFVLIHGKNHEPMHA